MIGKKIGQYRIIEQIDAGGMGEVYRARDMMLDRDVAVKMLPTVLATDPERLARSRREANLLAALTHERLILKTVASGGRLPA